MILTATNTEKKQEKPNKVSKRAIKKPRSEQLMTYIRFKSTKNSWYNHQKLLEKSTEACEKLMSYEYGGRTIPTVEQFALFPH